MSTKTEIGARELWERLHGKSDRPFFLLDVRNDEERKGWRIEGTTTPTTVELPYFRFIDDEEAAVAAVPKDLGEAVVVCAKGGSSEYVAELLRSDGRGAVNLVGGMVAWGDLHVPVEVPTEDPRYRIWQFNRYGKGCLSYGIAAGGELAVVDPSRFPELYESFAAEHGLRIVEILETHVHADHLSGGPALAKRTGARYRVVSGTGREPQVGIDIAPIDGETPIRIGGAAGVTILARALKTPGHTPGSVSYLVGDRWLLSGDTLFVQGVGRPDLGGQVEAWGRMLHHTLREVVSQLPDHVQVLPAHFSSVAEEDGHGLVKGELGRLRATAPEFGIADPDDFVAAMRAGVKEAPAIYGEIVKANLGLVDPGEKATEWELGKNECAASAAKARAAASA